MKRSRKYRTYLNLLGILVLIFVLGILTASLYTDSVDETQNLLIESARTNLNAAAYQIDSELNVISSICNSLKSDIRIGKLISICAQEDVSRVSLLKANNELVKILDAYLYRCKSINVIHIQTPARIIETQRFNKNFVVPVTSAHSVSPSTNADGTVYFSFPTDSVENCRIYVELSSNALSELVTGFQNLMICDSAGQIIYDDVPPVSSDKLRSFLKAGKDQEIIDGCCFVKIHLLWNWDLVYIQEAKALFDAYTKTILLSIGIFILTSCIAYFIGRIISKKVLDPLHKLIENVHHFQYGKPFEATYGKPGLREGFFLYSTITVSFGIILLVVSFGYMSSRIQDEHRKNLKQATLSSITYSLENTLEEVKDEMLQIAFDSRIGDYVRNPSENRIAALEDAIREKIIRHGASGIICIYDRYGEMLYSSSSLINQYPLVTDSFGEWEYVRGIYGNGSIVLTMHLLTMSNYVQLNLDYDVLTVQMSRLSSQTDSIFLVDESLCPLDGGILPNGKTYLTKAISNTPWYACFCYDDILPADNVLRMLRNKSELIIAMLLSSVFLSSLLSSLLVKPLSQLTHAIGRVTNGKLSGLEMFPENHFAIDELNELNDSFIEMSEHIELLIDDLINSRNHMLMLENEKKNAEINALQMQITPHFLSNTVMLISDRIKSGNICESIDMLNAMNDLFRYGISRKELLISVAEEWEYGQAYAKIMSARKNFVRFEWHMDPEALNRFTIRLVLQPILENAIYHGVKNDGSATVVKVSCTALTDVTIFTVQDNGPGISDEKMVYLKKTLHDDSGISGIGLYNVQTRIRLYCGEKYGIEIENVPEGGAMFTLRLPASFN